MPILSMLSAFVKYFAGKYSVEIACFLSLEILNGTMFTKKDVFFKDAFSKLFVQTRILKTIKLN